MDLKEEHILKKNINEHWYYKAKAEVIKRATQKLNLLGIVDIGAGSGYFSRYLLQGSSAKTSTCIDTAYAQELSSEDLNGKKIEYLKKAPDKITADVALMIDVLEHIDDDKEFLSNYAQKLKANSRILISVPAFQFLWSGHDVFLDHKRRYTLKQVETLARSCDLEIERSFYFFAGVFPIAALLRLPSFLRFSPMKVKSQLKVHSTVTNILLGLICRLEYFFYKYNRLFGLSVFCIAKKK